MSATDATLKRRRGGRKARIAIRAAPLANDVRPVWPGMSSDRYQPLTSGDMGNIHTAILDILETVGMADAIPTCIDAITGVGGFINDKGRLCFPKALIEDTIASANHAFALCGQTPDRDLEPWGNKVYFGTGGAAVHIVNPTSGAYRDSTLSDLYDMARIVDRMEHIHFFQRPVVARDITGGFDLDVNTAYACVMGTTKHVGTSFVSPESTEATLKMLHVIAGGAEKWRARPFVSQSNCFVVPPMKFAVDACRCLEVAVHGGMPILLLSAGQAGATAPASLSGTVVQAWAEVLVGLVYVNALKPGAPAICGTWPFVSDLRTGAMSGGSGEQALLMSACGQMGGYYKLTTGVASAMTDAKVPDVQAGYEKGYSHALVGNSGANLVYEAAGMHASLLGACKESLVIDNDLIGAVQRTIRGIDTSADALSIDIIRQVCEQGPGHYLGHEQTLDLMERDYVYPALFDRSSPNEWAAAGSPMLLDRAIQKTNEILESHYPAHVSEAADSTIRSMLNIKLSKEAVFENGAGMPGKG